MKALKLSKKKRMILRLKLRMTTLRIPQETLLELKMDFVSVSNSNYTIKCRTTEGNSISSI